MSNLVRLSRGGGEEDSVGPNPFTATAPDIFLSMLMLILVTGGEMLPVLVSLISTGILRTKGSSKELELDMSGIWFWVWIGLEGRDCMGERDPGMDLGVDRPELSVSIAAAAAASAAEDDDTMGAVIVIVMVEEADADDIVDAGDEAAARNRNASDTFSCRDSTSLAEGSFAMAVSFSFSLSLSFSFALPTLPSFTSFSFSFSFSLSFSFSSVGVFADFFGLITAIAIAGIGIAGVGRGSKGGLSGGRRRL